MLGSPPQDTVNRPVTAGHSRGFSIQRRVMSAKTRSPRVDYVPFPYMELYQHYPKTPSASRTKSFTMPEKSLAGMLHKIQQSVTDNENRYVHYHSSVTPAVVPKAARKPSDKRLPGSTDLCINSIPLGISSSTGNSPGTRSPKVERSQPNRKQWRWILDRTEKAMEMKSNHGKQSLLHVRTAIRNTFNVRKGGKIQSNAMVVLFPGEQVTTFGSREAHITGYKSDITPSVPIRLHEKTTGLAYARKKKVDVSVPEAKEVTGKKTGVVRVVRKQNGVYQKTLGGQGKTEKKDAQSLTDMLDEEDSLVGIKAKYI